MSGRFATVSGAKPSGYVPSPKEKAYFDKLFQAADTANHGALSAQTSVLFLRKSGLDNGILKTIWDIAAKGAQLLTRENFYTICRLVAMAQNGKPCTKEALSAMTGMELPLPKFEGIDIGGGGRDGAGGAGAADPWDFQPGDVTKMQTIFARTDSSKSGFVSVPDALILFRKSGVPEHVLQSVVRMADMDRDGRLNLFEFAVGMHLIIGISKRNMPLPPELPPVLRRPPPGLDRPLPGHTGALGGGPQGMGGMGGMGTYPGGPGGYPPRPQGPPSGGFPPHSSAMAPAGAGDSGSIVSTEGVSHDDTSSVGGKSEKSEKDEAADKISSAFASAFSQLGMGVSVSNRSSSTTPTQEKSSPSQPQSQPPRQESPAAPGTGLGSMSPQVPQTTSPDMSRGSMSGGYSATTPPRQTTSPMPSGPPPHSQASSFQGGSASLSTDVITNAAKEVDVGLNRVLHEKNREYERISLDNSELMEQLETLKRDRMAVERQIKFAGERLERERADQHRLREEIAQAREELRKLRSQSDTQSEAVMNSVAATAKLEGTLEGLLSQIAELQGKGDQLMAESSRYADQAASTQMEALKVDSAARQMHAMAAQNEAMMQGGKSEETMLQKMLAAAHARVRSLTQYKQQMMDRLEKAGGNLTEATRAFEKAEEAAKQARDKYVSWSNRRSQLRGELAAAEAQAEGLEAGVKAFTNMAQASSTGPSSTVPQRLMSEHSSPDREEKSDASPFSDVQSPVESMSPHAPPATSKAAAHSPMNGSPPTPGKITSPPPAAASGQTPWQAAASDKPASPAAPVQAALSPAPATETKPEKSPSPTINTSPPPLPAAAPSPAPSPSPSPSPAAAGNSSEEEAENGAEEDPFAAAMEHHSPQNTSFVTPSPSKPSVTGSQPQTNEGANANGDDDDDDDEDFDDMGFDDTAFDEFSKKPMGGASKPSQTTTQSDSKQSGGEWDAFGSGDPFGSADNAAPSQDPPKSSTQGSASWDGFGDDVFSSDSFGESSPAPAPAPAPAASNDDFDPF